MRIRRLLRSLSVFVSQLGIALLKAVVTGALIGAFAIGLAHYMGVPMPSAHDVLGGLSRLADILS